MPHSSCRSDARNKDKEREQVADRKLLWSHFHLANDTPSTYYTCKEELDAPNTLVGRTHAAAQQAKQQAERIVSSATSLSTSCPSSTEVTSTISHASVCNDSTRSSVPSAPPCQGWIPPVRAMRAVSPLAQDDYVHAVLSASLRWGNSPTEALQLE